MAQNYSEDCDYLRQRFNLPDTTGLYHMVHVVTDFIKSLDEEKATHQVDLQVTQQVTQQVTESEETLPEKPKSQRRKKRGRPRKTK